MSTSGNMVWRSVAYVGEKRHNMIVIGGVLGSHCTTPKSSSRYLVGYNLEHGLGIYY